MAYPVTFTEQILSEFQSKVTNRFFFLSATSKFRNSKIKENVTFCQKIIANQSSNIQPSPG